MNYACVFLMAVLFAALFYWIIRGRKVYTGPVTEAVADDLSENEQIVAEKTDKGVSV